jgi:membrane-bound metal-dependent hydrolase YbcI (DUF457 family)
MCTPVGHTLAGGALLTSVKGGLSDRWLFFILVMVFANLPDIDLLFGAVRGNPNLFHHHWTHSIVFCVFTGTAGGFLLSRRLKMSRGRSVLLMTGILLTHVLLDFFTRDTSEPFGQQLFWPFSSGFVASPWTPLPDVYKSSANRTFINALFSLHNLKTVAAEAAVFGPLFLAVRQIKKRGEQ